MECDRGQIAYGYPSRYSNITYRGLMSGQMAACGCAKVAILVLLGDASVLVYGFGRL